VYTVTDMRAPDALVESLLKKGGVLNADQLKKLHEQATTDKKTLQEIAIQSGKITEADLTRLYAQEIDVPFADFLVGNLQKNTLKLIPERVARQYGAVAFDVDEDGVVFVALEDPDDIQTINFLQKQLGKPIRVHIAPTSVIQSALDQYGTNNVGTELAKVIPVEDKEPIDEEVDEKDVTEDSPIAQTVNLIIDYGIKNRASDIHIEPRENLVIVRYRVDGVLHEANKLPRKMLGALVSRIKILSNLKIDEHRAPQDGRFKISINDHMYALRVSTLPIVDGEKVVMRILDESSKAPTLEELGYWGMSLERVEQAIHQPHGKVLVTGPTGSGKSTSLFSVLNKLNNSSVNISTVEDPVEYRIVGVNQTQVNPLAGMTFVNGLRALLRQDPNIIMVGEIRDGETADLAVQAALTGHLVFSTLHTNNAATCLPRLLDMGVEPFLIASTVRIVIGQRLVRRLCPDCSEEYKPDEGIISRVKDAFAIKDTSGFAYIHDLEKQALDAGIGAKDTGKRSTGDLGTDSKTIVKLWKAHEEGCNACNHSGYRGRMGVYEVLANNTAVQRLIMSNSTSEDLEAQAVRDGMVTMQMDGLIKALRGQTTIEEVMRVTSTEG
jgi:type IV pilus assembly protein PilB